MKDIRPWKLFGREASSTSPLRASGEASPEVAGASPTSDIEGLRLGPEDFADPIMVIDREGGLVGANTAARALARGLSVALDEPGGVERLLAAVRMTNGGGAPPWVPTTDAAVLEAIVSEPQPWPDAPVFELGSTPRRDVDGRPSGWVVRLIDVTRLVSTCRAQNAAVGHRDKLLKLMSHDMRSPLAAILATLTHSDLAEMPANLKQIIENAARRALHMVDSNVRSIRAETSSYLLADLDFSHVVEEVIDACWSASKAAGVKIILDSTDETFSILADRGYLTDAFIDLVGKLLTGSTRGDRLVCSFEAAALQGKPAVTLTIKDGHGESIVRNRSQESRGLAALSEIEADASDDSAGLDFFQTVIARHHGVIIWDIEPGVGRSVAITLPIFS